jgi:hypothetical protein
LFAFTVPSNGTADNNQAANDAGAFKRNGAPPSQAD